MAVPTNYAFLRNARAYLAQRIDPRAGLVALSQMALDQPLVHSLKRINDDAPSAAATFARIIGAGTKLYLNAGTVAIDTGYSGNPLSMVAFRPEQSPESWVYIADSLKMRKVRVDGTNFQMGIAPPAQAPVVSFGPPEYLTIDDLDQVGSWVNGGTAGALNIVTRYSSTIAHIIYDSLTGGWACVNPNLVSDQLQRGMILTVGSGGTVEPVIVDSILQPIAATTITSIAYDSGVFGLCTIHLKSVSVVGAQLGYDPSLDLPDVPDFTDRISRVGDIRRAQTNKRSPTRVPTQAPLGLAPNALIRINAGFGTDEVVRVLSVSRGPDGSVSFRCSTGANHVNGEPITGLLCLRVYFLFLSHAPGENLVAKGMNSSVSVGTGTITLTSPQNLSIGAPIGRAIQETDEIHIGLRIDNPANVVEGRLMFDVDASTNDFAHNYFFKAFRASDLTPAVQGTQSVLATKGTVLSRDVVDKFGQTALNPPPTRTSSGKDAGQRNVVDIWLERSGVGRKFGKGGVPVSGQSATGTGQWTELRFKVSDLTRVGADASRSLANVAAIRVQLTVTATVSFTIDDLWVGGTFGPDIGDIGAPYLYRYRGRSKVTGAKSLAGPATRSGIEAHNQQVLVVMSAHPDLQVDTLDVFRWGGSLAQWTYVGSAPNSNPQLFDNLDDLSIANAPTLDFDTFQPFPTIGLPNSGKVNVVGTRITWVSGDQFNPAWAPGTQININGVLYTLYAPPTATSLEVVENGGTQTNQAYFVTRPTLLGQPLPAMWGPFAQGTAAFIFACGDLYQPGVLFLTKGNDPDSAPDTLQIEITPPSEPMMNGVMYNGRSYAWSSERFFALYPSFGGSGFIETGGQIVPGSAILPFTPIEVPNGKGLFARWAFAVGPRIWFLAKDGIYETTGGEPVSITNEDLFLLFPHEGQPGSSVTIGSILVNPPDMTQTANLRLSYSDNHLYFDFIDTLGTRRTLVYNILMKIWQVDDYIPTIVTHYAEEGRGVHSLLLGGTDGRVYQASGTLDGSNPFPMEIRMPQLSELAGGYEILQDGYLGVAAPADLSLVVNVDGVDNPITFPNTAGVYQRGYVRVPPLKGKLMAFALISTQGFSLMQRDCEFRLGEWGRKGEFRRANPFSDLRRAMKPKIQ